MNMRLQVEAEIKNRYEDVSNPNEFDFIAILNEMEVSNNHESAVSPKTKEKLEKKITI